MRLNINRFITNKKIYFFIGGVFIHFLLNGQTLIGDNISIIGSTGMSSITQSSGGINSGISVNQGQTFIYTDQYSGGSYTANSFIEAETTGVTIGSSGTVDLFVGSVDPTTGSITGTGGLTLASTFSGVYSLGAGTSSYIGWAATASELSATSTTANGFLASSSGAYIQSASDIILTGTTINLTGATNINTTGNYSTSIGSSGTGTVAMTSGSNSIALSMLTPTEN